MLWVWLDNSPGGLEVAAATPLLMSGDMRQRDKHYRDHVAGPAGAVHAPGPAPHPVVWYMREMPYSYEVLMENLVDPAHLPHSHHGVAPWLNR